jgi:hypothetical protein
MIHPMLRREPVAYVEFIAGVRLPVYDDGRRQYVLDDDGEPIYGVWYIPREYDCDQPINVDPDPF